MNDPDLNRQYTPSSWSKRFSDGKAVLNHHLTHIIRETKNAILNLSHELNIPYGNGEREKMDIYGTDLPESSPIMVFIHGGFWHELSKDESGYFAESLYRIGFKTIVVGYDLCPNVTLERIVRQIKEAAVSVLKYAAKINSNAVYFIGHSAGAHLVAQLLSDVSIIKNDRIKAVFLISGIYDLVDLLETAENEYLRLNESDAVRLSPIVDAYDHLSDRIKIHIIVGENDSDKFIEQSKRYHEHLSQFAPVVFIIEPNDHFDIMETLSDEDNYLTRLLINTRIIK